jgi:hypothetical protein
MARAQERGSATLTPRDTNARGADYVAIELVENAETRSYYTAHKLPAIAQRVIKLYEGDTFSLSALADLLGRRLGLRRYSKRSWPRLSA